MTQPENIGALARWLAGRDLSAFNMFQPLRTVGKIAMAEMARSEVEEILRDFMDDDSRGLVFTREQLARHVESNLSVKSGKWQGDFERLWAVTCIKAMSGDTNVQRRVRTENTRKRLYCFRARQEEAKALSEAAARREAVKWGGIDVGVTQLEVLLGGKREAGSQAGSHEEDEEGQ
ncbi:MAG: hypothetical protein EHM67_09455 [Hyphomicrobiaceae bacterium]|nr:MAG: hypothetical protein EHM67_09455 [Hyphomicrobiaceae bacterium]